MNLSKLERQNVVESFSLIAKSPFSLTPQLRQH